MGANYILIGDYDQLHSFLQLMHGKTEELFNLHFYTKLKVMALKEEWFGNEANAFFEIMENHLLPSLVKVIEAMTATQDRIKEVMRTIHNADEETQVFFSTDALTSDQFASMLFLETLSPTANQAGVTSLVGGAAGATSGGAPVNSDAAVTTDKSKDPSHDNIKAHHKPEPAHTPPQPPEKKAGKVRSERSGEMSGLSEMGSSLKGGHASSAQVGGAGASQAGTVESGLAGSGSGASGSSSSAGSAPAGDAGTGTPTPDGGLASGAGIGAGAAAAAAAIAAARVVKEDQHDE